VGERPPREKVGGVRHQAVPLFAAATILCGVAALSPGAGAQTVPQPTASPSASPAPPPKPSKFSLKISTYTSGTNQQFVGPGTTPAEGPVFAAGSQLAPGVPYDFFSGGSQATGQGISQDFELTPTLAVTSDVDMSLTIGYGSASGTGNVVNYWGDAIMPTINTNLGSRAYTLTPAFTTHNGQNPISATKLSILSGSIMAHNGNGGVTFGWLNLHQNVGFAFSQAPWVSTPFEVVPQLPGSIGDGAPAVDVLKGDPTVYPLSGVDGWWKNGIATFEAASALLPAPYLSPARVDTLSGIIDQGGGLKYSAQLSMLQQTGPEVGRMLFGSAPSLVDGIPQSTLFGQHQVVLGLGATFPLGAVDGELRYGYSCYNAVGTAASTSSCTSGNYIYGKLHHGFSNFDLAGELVRFDASYAPAVLDYGTIENIDSYAAMLPSNSLRGTYQLVDTAEVGPNRQGFRLSGSFLAFGVEVRLAYARYSQIQALDATSSHASGFIEPYFLPQLTGGTIGLEQRAEAWFKYPWKIADVTLDLSQVNTWRTGTAPVLGNDNVRMQYPAAVLGLTRPFGPKVTGSAGVGRFALNGQFNTAGADNAQLTQNMIFAGAQLRSNSNSGYGLEWRLYSVSGTPTLPGGPSPAYHGPQIQFYQRFKT
jgi:hypothetical protein